MAQTDYEKFQKFHRATFLQSLEMLEIIQQLQNENATLNAKVARSISCQLRNT